jgi:hypothetical protein
VPPLGAAHEVVVRRHDAGGDEHVLLERRVRGHVCVRLDLRAGTDENVVLDEGAASDDDVLAELAALTNAGLVADDDPLPQPRSREDDGAGEDAYPLRDDEGRQLFAGGGRIARQHRRLPDYGVVADDDILAQFDALIDDRGLGDPGH